MTKSFSQIYKLLTKYNWELIDSSYMGGMTDCTLRRGNRKICMVKSDESNRVLVRVMNSADSAN